MAITTIHPIKTTVHKAIKYICNPDKSDNLLLVSSFATSPQTAKYDFKYALSKTNSDNSNLAFHLIQSFSPGEVGREEAHQIGRELADQILQGQYSYIIATHIDKEHCHNHIIFCAANNVTHKKYYDTKKSYYRIRNLSDTICQEHNLSIITTKAHNVQCYKEWLANKNNVSWKTQLRNDIDDAISQSESYEAFLSLIRKKGYEIKGEALNVGLKYISFRPPSVKNFIRGRANSLGEEYTKERINERIKAQNIASKGKKIVFPTIPAKLQKDRSASYFINISNPKFQNNPGLYRWAAKHNLKLAASIYSDGVSLADLESSYSQMTQELEEMKASLIRTKSEIKGLKEIIKYVKQYKENEPFHNKYLKAKDRDQYYRNHDTQLLLFNGAVNMLNKYSINSKTLDLIALQNDMENLISTESTIRQDYYCLKKEIYELKKIKAYLFKDSTHELKLKRDPLEHS